MNTSSPIKKLHLILLSTISLVLILAAVAVTILNTYKPMYKVTVGTEFIGYFESKQHFDEVYQTLINEKINIDENVKVYLDENPKFEKSFVRVSLLDKQNVYTALRASVRTEHNVFAINVDNEEKMKFNNKEDAESYATKLRENAKNANVEIKETVVKEDPELTNKESANAILKDIVSRHKPVEEKKDEIKPVEENPYITTTGAYGGIWPTRSRYVSCKFGGYKGHTGTDIAGAHGDPNIAYKGGKVIFAGWAGAYGYLVKLDHGNGIQSWYAHNYKLTVKAGQYVKQGQTVGLQGSTGNSTGTHLHFEIRINGRPVNALKYL